MKLTGAVLALQPGLFQNGHPEIPRIALRNTLEANGLRVHVLDDISRRGLFCPGRQRPVPTRPAVGRRWLLQIRKRPEEYLQA